MLSIVRKFTIFSVRWPAKAKCPRRRPKKSVRYMQALEKQRLCNQVLRSAMIAQEKQFEARLRRARTAAHPRALDFQKDPLRSEYLITARVDRRLFMALGGKGGNERIMLMNTVVVEFAQQLERQLASVNFADVDELCKETAQQHLAMRA